MSAPSTLEIISPGAYASVQDKGRRGLRRVGVPWAGVLDPRLMCIANALVGNTENTPVIECFDGGLQLAARGGALRLAVAGYASVELESAGERHVLQAWRSLTLAAGDILRLRKLEHGRIAVIAVQGMTLPKMLGSASTYARARLGGVDGRALAAGDHLPTGRTNEQLEQMLPRAPAIDTSPIRVIVGPQADHFSADTLAAFANNEYRVTGEADRMGVRLAGPELKHLGAREIVSDATVPGSIQVPGNGQPIVLLADAQTAGGYPKIATVIGADLPRVAASRPGQMLRFTLIDAEEGERMAHTAEAETRALLASMRPLLLDGIDEAALYSSNLVTGFIDARSSEYRLKAEKIARPGNL